jgi:hypothetical protein
MPRAMRVEYPGSIYDGMDRGDRREEILIIGRAKGAKSVLHRSGRGQHQHKPARPTNHAPRENSNLRFEAASARAAKPAQEWPVSVV